MPPKMQDAEAVGAIQQWFTSHCDGTWEHELGVKLESTDNPGWLMTFRELSLNKASLARSLEVLMNTYDAQVATDNRMVRVYSSTLSGCLAAAAILIRMEGTQSP